MAHRQRDYELYENISPINSPGTHVPEFFTPGSPEATRTKFGYRTIPSRNISLPSAIDSSRISGDRLERIRSREMQMLWGTKIHWFLPSSMVGLLVLGIMGSIAHDWFYRSLHGKEARNQLNMVRIGTALAFFTKAMLVGSVVIAYRFVYMIGGAMSQMLTSLIGNGYVVEDPTHFTTSIIYKKAKLATAMAVVTWIIPLASVLSPAALTTELAYIKGGNDTCTVPTLNFNYENTNDWRKPRFRAGESLAFWNTTPIYDEDKFSNGTVWYDQPSFNAVRLFTLTSMSHTFIPMSTPCYRFNCSWILNFDGPWYNCSLKGAEDFTNAKRLSNTLAPDISFANLAPEGNIMFFAENDVEEYARPQSEYLSNISTTQGIFKNEPKLWFGWTVNTTRPVSNESNARYKGRWKYELERNLMECELQKAHYEITFNHTNNIQYNTNVNITNGEAINPDGRDMHPTQSNYKEYAAFHALGQLTRKQVLGKITQENWTEQPRTFSTVSQTKLVNPDTALAQVDLKEKFQTFFEEVVISLLSESFLGISDNTTLSCTMLRYQNNFRYQRDSLWGGYAVSIAVAFACIVIGGTSLRSNGITSDTTFSKIMVTTRNKTIDRLVEEYEGVCLGGDPFPKELEQTQFQFGVIDEISTQGRALKHAAFGTSDEVIPIQKGDSYARLSARGSHYQSSNSWVPRSGQSSPVNTRFARPI